MSSTFHGQGSSGRRFGCDCKACRPVGLSTLVRIGHVTPQRAERIIRGGSK